MTAASLSIPAQKTLGRWLGVLLLLRMGVGIYNNFFVLGPLSFSKNFMDRLGAYPEQLQLGIGITALNAALNILLALLLMRLLNPRFRLLCWLYLALVLVHCVLIWLDISAIQTMAKLSRQYISNTDGVARAQDYAQGLILQLDRERTHFLDLIGGFVIMLLFFWIFLKARLTPGFVYYFGLFAAACGLINFSAQLLGVFDGANLLMLPAALSQLLTAFWLLVKSVKTTP